MAHRVRAALFDYDPRPPPWSPMAWRCAVPGGDSQNATVSTVRAASFSQQRLWFLDQLRPGSSDYLLPMALRVLGGLDVGALTKAFAAVVDRHEILRTRYVAADGDPIQHIDARVDTELRMIDVTGLAAAERDQRVPALIKDELATPFDLAGEAPLRLALARFADDDHLLLVTVHHIAFDGWSWGVLGRELAAGYREHTGGAPADLPALPKQYGDFADWQRDLLSGPRLTRQLDYWRDRLTGIEPLRLPTDLPRPPQWDGAGDVVRFDLPADLVAAADALARGAGSTRYMVLLAAFKTLLARYTGQTDLAVGTPVAGRGRTDLEGMIGLFVNTLVLRTDLSGTSTFRSLIHRVRDTTLSAFSGADAPFERIVTELTPERDLSRNPLFQVSFSLLNAVGAQITLPGLDVELIETPLTGSPFDLTLDLKTFPGGRVGARLQYATALFDRATIDQIGHAYLDVLRAALYDPDATVADLGARAKLLPAKEKVRLLAYGTGPVDEVGDETVTELIDRQALSTPDALAVACGQDKLTYAELVAKADRLARHLRAHGVGLGSVVGVHLDRGVELLVTFLAVLKSGAAYLPLDPVQPVGRLAAMAADAGVRVVVTETALDAKITDTSILVDRDQIDADTGSLDQVAGPDDLAYVIYTSGSTGAPKGVMIHHRGLVNFVLAMLDRPGLRAGQAVIGLTTMSFDPSVLELYVPLLVGAHVVLADTEEARDPQRMAALIERTDPVIVQATPTTLRMLLDVGWTPPARLTVLCGGEKMTAELIGRLTADGAPVWDLYGPTETTVWATTARVGGDWAAATNYTVHILDPHLDPVPDLAVGEIHVGGVGVAFGYLGKPGLTAAAFVPDPYGPPGSRRYRTGDLARRHPDGTVEILGRGDHQVKIRGHRIELGEIENALLGHPAIRAAVVHPAPADTGDLRLTGYLIAHTQAPSPEELREFLLATLPDYMAPEGYVVLDAYPLTSSGKVDRKALPIPEARPAAAAFVEPRSTDERVVAGVWQEVLGGPEVGAHENFFDIGGHSLLATRVAVRLRAAFGIDVPVRALFDHSTVAALAAALPDYPRVTERSAIPALTGRRRGHRREDAR
ncbi:non-ribosomal peptide synthetase [Alloactinosynnema sp. L-07]|uniref:non-ribosomal peptide synthetase n=1 Tax=Alloactinosynnema sp. L-07 TaxID=1653480 RepID=UPI0018D306AF|nr:non-ribosomal peptide synthetase [Alloactinosynnema sp. L-07]